MTTTDGFTPCHLSSEPSGLDKDLPQNFLRKSLTFGTKFDTLKSVEIDALEQEFPSEPLDYKSLITKEEYLILLQEQSGVCAICKKESKASRRARVLAVDHDHKTGFIRGLLCTKCNLILGYATDDVGVLQRAINYLHASKIRQQWPEKDPALRRDDQKGREKQQRALPIV